MLWQIEFSIVELDFVYNKTGTEQTQHIKPNYQN